MFILPYICPIIITKRFSVATVVADEFVKIIGIAEKPKLTLAIVQHHAFGTGLPEGFAVDRKLIEAQVRSFRGFHPA